MLYFGERCLIRLFSSASACPRALRIGPARGPPSVARRPRLAVAGRLAGLLQQDARAGRLGNLGDLFVEVMEGQGLLWRGPSGDQTPKIGRAPLARSFL